MPEASGRQVTAEKERMFQQFTAGEITIEQLSAGVYELDHPVRRARHVLKLLIGLLSPLLVIGRTQES